jgi:hypothetical protein
VSPGGFLVRARRAAARVIVSGPARPVLGRLPATRQLVARAAFRTGRDEVCEAVLDRLARRDPGSVPAAVLRADLRSFQGRYEAALAAVADRSAGSAAATARVVRLGHRVWQRSEAERAAVAAVRQFPRSVQVWWQAALACDNPAHYGQLAEAWQAQVRQPADLLPVVRPLAVAAGRAGRLVAATGWYRRAVELLLTTGRPGRPLPVTRLAGLGAPDAIGDLCQVLDRARVPFFFAAGTALGLVRDGRPLGTDSDLDVGVFAEDWDRPRLVELFTRDPRFDLDPHPQSEKVGLRHRGGSPVDIFRFYEEDGRRWHDGVFVRWWNSPFQVVRRVVGGRAVPLPADPERYLAENYGDWRTPVPGFDAFTDDAPNLQVTWPEYQRVHLVRRGYARLAGGDRAGAARELARAGEAELAAELTAAGTWPGRSGGAAGSLIGG